MNKLLLTTTLCLLFATPAVADGSQVGQQRARAAVASSDTGVPSANPDTGVPSANPDTGGGVPTATAAAPSAPAAAVVGGDAGTPPTPPVGGNAGTPPTPPVGGNPAGITKVNQLTAQLANVTKQYQFGNYNKQSYAYYRMTRLTKQLAAAQAAAAAGTPQAPVLTENGQVMAVPSIY